MADEYVTREPENDSGAMIESRICPACDTEFDWPGVEVDEEVYCCVPCSHGEECVCPEHDHLAVRAGVAATPLIVDPAVL